MRAITSKDREERTLLHYLVGTEAPADLLATVLVTGRCELYAVRPNIEIDSKIKDIAQIDRMRRRLAAEPHPGGGKGRALLRWFTWRTLYESSSGEIVSTAEEPQFASLLLNSSQPVSSVRDSRAGDARRFVGPLGLGLGLFTDEAFSNGRGGTHAPERRAVVDYEV